MPRTIISYFAEEEPVEWEQGGVNLFVKRFERRGPFRREQVELSDPLAEVPEVEVGSLTYCCPIPLFASWYEVAARTCQLFSSGWLNSEMGQEYIFERKADGLWYPNRLCWPCTAKKIKT